MPEKIVFLDRDGVINLDSEGFKRQRNILNLRIYMRRLNIYYAYLSRYNGKIRYLPA